MDGKITLGFFTRNPDHSIVQQRSKKIEYPTVEAAREAAKKVLETYPHVTFVDICVTPPMGHLRQIEKIER